MYSFFKLFQFDVDMKDSARIYGGDIVVPSCKLTNSPLFFEASWRRQRANSSSRGSFNSTHSPRLELVLERYKVLARWRGIPGWWFSSTSNVFQAECLLDRFRESSYLCQKLRIYIHQATEKIDKNQHKMLVFCMFFAVKYSEKGQTWRHSQLVSPQVARNVTVRVESLEPLGKIWPFFRAHICVVAVLMVIIMRNGPIWMETLNGWMVSCFDVWFISDVNLLFQILNLPQSTDVEASSFGSPRTSTSSIEACGTWASWRSSRSPKRCQLTAVASLHDSPMEVGK